MLFFRINLTKNVAHPVFLMHIQSLLSGYAPGADSAISRFYEQLIIAHPKQISVNIL